MATMVLDVSALKGVISAHEEAIIELEREVVVLNCRKNVGEIGQAVAIETSGTFFGPFFPTHGVVEHTALTFDGCF